MTSDAVAAKLQTVRNWRRRMIIRSARELRPWQGLPRRRGIPPPQRAGSVTLPASRAGIRARKRYCHELYVANVTLQADAHLGMWCNGHIRIEPMRISTPLVTCRASSFQCFVRSESVRNARRRARVRTQRTIRCERARMCSSSNFQRWIDRQHGSLRAKYVGFGGNWLGGQRHRRRGNLFGRRIAICRDTVRQHNHRENCSDRRYGKHDRDQHS